MSLIKKLDDISETKERSKSLMEALNKVETAMNELKGTKKSPAKSTKTKVEKKEKVEEA